MDQLVALDYPFVQFVTESLSERGFVLIDVGAAYGIAPAWRSFGGKLQGFGFDPDPDEVSRLNAAEPAPDFKYIAGLVGLGPEHPFAQQRRGQPRLRRNPWFRLGVTRWSAIRRMREQGLSIAPDTRVQQRPGAYAGENGEEPAEPIIDLAQFLSSNALPFVDFLKIDVDGTDFDILQSLDGSYEAFSILGVGIEVNFFGSAAPTDNTFHNTDRFLKQQGFELFDVSVRRYSMQDLPGYSQAGHRYPAETPFGRPLQGDAFYARDICSSGQRDFAETLSSERLAKVAAIFSLFRLPDCAVEVLVTFRDRLSTVIDVDHGLDLLARQAQPGCPNPLSYVDYIAEFEKRTYNLD